MDQQPAYEPLDPSAYRNAPVTLLANDEHPPAVGHQQFRGLPFAIGEGDATFVGLGSSIGSSVITIRVDHQAFCVLFAHRLINSRRP